MKKKDGKSALNRGCRAYDNYRRKKKVIVVIEVCQTCINTSYITLFITFGFNLEVI